MAEPARAPRMSLQAFIAWEEAQHEPHELHDGEVFAMSSGTMAHYAVSTNILFALSSALRAHRLPCQALPHGMRVVTPAGNSYYPDVLITCGQHPGDALSIGDPVLIVEVLSPSTEAFDRGGKWRAYQTIPALAVYMLIDPRVRSVETYTRADRGWTFVSLPKDADEVEIAPLGLSVKVADFYEGVDQA